MNKRLKLGLAGLLAAGAIAVPAAGTVLAQAQDQSQMPPATTTAPSREGRGFGKGFGMRMGDETTLKAAAEALEMTADELSTQLRGGKTMADLAEEKGVALADVQAAVEAAQKAASKDAIEQAVTDGTLSREKADWMLEGIDKGYLPGFGFGGGRRDRGPGGFDQPQQAPSTDPTSSGGA